MGKNINEIDHTNIILNVKYITHSVLFQIFLPKVLPGTVCKKPNKDAKTEAIFDDRSRIEFMSTTHPKDWF